MTGVMYRQNLNRVELEICTACNLRCLQCDRSSAQAPSNEYMTVRQIERFVEESVRMRWLWYELEVLGGEPTLHPQFSAVIDTLLEYAAFNDDCRVIVVSNGHGRQVNRILSRVPSSVVIENTKKTVTNHIPFNDYNIAPIDMAQYRNDKFERGCRIVAECGLGLTRYGYYACGAGASVDRVFGMDIGIKKLAAVTDESLLRQRKVLCRYCGHYKGMHYETREKQELSASWRTAYEQYREESPRLSVYGE